MQIIGIGYKKNQHRSITSCSIYICIKSHMFCRAMDSRRSVIDGNEDTDYEECNVKETGKTRDSDIHVEVIIKL